jgi:ATP-dependent DNA helicase RecQ
MESAALEPSTPLEILRQVFDYDDFREGQRAAIEAVVDGRDAVVLLPTGGGKSLCYQVPALVAARAGRGTTVVISPLIALMQDQVAALQGRGVEARAIHSSQEDHERLEAMDALRDGWLELLYVSPERAALVSFKRMLQRSNIALLAIDEAHCVSQWGHDFRPEYMRLGELREIVNAPTIALTATATPEVMNEIVEQLELRDPAMVQGNFRRPNLSFSVEHHSSDASKLEALVRALDADGFRDKRGAGRAIVYCATRKKTELVAKSLKAGGFTAGYYHAGRTKLARERAMRAFDTRRTRVLVATNAFGMGIDYPDVRVLVHFQTPGSLEAYYQEAGRAGRDGLPGSCMLLFGRSDLVTQRRLKSSQSTSAKVERRNEQALAAIEGYASADQCRQTILCAHFTGTDDHPSCEVCDVCVDPVGAAEAMYAQVKEKPPIEPLPPDAIERIVDGVTNLNKPVGKSSLAKALRGSRAKALRRLGLITLPEHGTLRSYDERSIVAAIEALLEEGRLERRGKKYPTVWLAGRPVRRARGTEAPTESKTTRAPRRSRYNAVVRSLDNYRKRMARSLKWKPYMVFHRRVIVEIDRQRPTSLTALEKIPGLGPAKIERFGLDILDLVRRNEHDV